MGNRKFYIDNILASHVIKSNNNYTFFQCIDGKIRKICSYLYDSTLSKNQVFRFEGV